MEQDGRGVRRFEQCARAAVKALTKLQVVERLIELRSPPSNNFEALRGEEGRYCIRIDRKWRLCFRWRPLVEPVPEGQGILMVQGEPYDVEISNHYD
ncbi:MAG: type II toxin-antitoxin system RelE/ParE family toxin [Stellaceae bacterium]